MTFTPCPKPHRHVNRAAIEEQRTDHCEVCGRFGPVQIHHIQPKASGGPDSAENLIALCAFCHREAHNSHLSKNDLWRAVAERDGRPIAEIREACLQYRAVALTGRRVNGDVDL